MPAKSKLDLITVSDREFAKLQALLEPLGPDEALLKDATGVSIKDVIGHRAHWIELFLGWYKDGKAGKEVHFPEKGYKWNELPRYNADLREAQKDMDWPTALTLLKKNHRKLSAFIEKQTETALYGGPMPGAKNDWTTGRWAEAAGPSHYRSAAKFIRGRLKEIRG